MLVWTDLIFMNSTFFQRIAELVFCLAVSSVQLNGQCNPALAQTCSSVPLLCSLDELNGLSCSNAGTLPSSCSPICSQGGAAENTAWWGFTGNGNNVSITLNAGSCANSQGLEFGVLLNCKCASSVACKSNPCVPPGGSATLTFNTQQCAKYYLWVDGCNADICDFTIQTAGGALPPLTPLGFINNDPGRVFEICKGYCSYHFFVQNQNDGCYINYRWTIDGVPTGDIERNLYLDLPKEGDFQLCVTQQLMNPGDVTMVCNEQGPQCATIKVRSLADRFGAPRTLCWETANPKPFKWFNQFVTTSGEYRAHVSDNHCCEFDSIVQFTVLDEPTPKSVYYITCDNKPYIDLLGKKHQPCLSHEQILLQKTSVPYKCDSSIYLTALQVDFAPSWAVNCIGGKVELVPNVKVLKPCEAGETYEFDYNWYLKKDTTKLISKDERLLVNASSEDYVLKVNVITTIESEIAMCTRTFYESFDEGNVTPSCFALVGEPVYCFDQTGFYAIDSLVNQKVNFYNWTVDRGQIVSNADSSSVQINWMLSPGDTGRVCASYTVDCGTSCVKCKSVVLDHRIAGPDFSQRGLSANLDALAHANGMWRLISGPHPVKIYEPSNPKTRISAYNYGMYCFEWSISANNCTVRDTLCVELYSGKRASPEYPDRLFDFRGGRSGKREKPTLNIFTPNLLRANGSSYLSVNGCNGSRLRYSWVNMMGRKISDHQLILDSGTTHVEINIPKEPGVYFIQVQCSDLIQIARVCVLE